MERIVVGTDGSATSTEALRWAADEAGRRGAALEIVFVWDNPYRDMWLLAEPRGTEPLAHFRGALERTVSAVLGRDPVVPVETVVAEGHAAQVLVDRARGADMLVVGSRGRGGLTGALLGSVSAACAAHSTCPVVIVRGAGGR